MLLDECSLLWMNAKKHLNYLRQYPFSKCMKTTFAQRIEAIKNLYLHFIVYLITSVLSAIL